MFYYKKDNQIYSFVGASLSPSEYQNFMLGILEGTLVGDYFTSPYEYCRKSDNTIWGLAIELSDSELILFHTGTLSFNREEIIENVPTTVEYDAVFIQYPIVHPPVGNLPDWARVQQKLYRTMAFVKALNSPSQKFGFVSDCILSGKESSESVFESTFRDGIQALIGDLSGTEYTFNQTDVDAINSALSNCDFTIQITLT